MSEPTAYLHDREYNLRDVTRKYIHAGYLLVDALHIDLSESASLEANIRVLDKLLERLYAAEIKHPVFAEGIWQGLGRVSEELGEASRAANKREGEDRVLDEMLDVLVTAWRFYRGDWRVDEE